MSLRQVALALESEEEEQAADRTMQARAQGRGMRRRRSGVELIGIVGGNWVVLNRDPLIDGSFRARMGGSVESGLRKVCRILALD